MLQTQVKPIGAGKQVAWTLEPLQVPPQLQEPSGPLLQVPVEQLLPPTHALNSSSNGLQGTPSQVPPSPACSAMHLAASVSSDVQSPA